MKPNAVCGSWAGLFILCAKSKLGLPDCVTVHDARILFRCPNTGYHVQGWFAEDVSDNGEDTYQSLTCLACRQVHLVNPKTGNVVGATGE